MAEWGEGIFGIEAAARRYFGKGAVSLTAQEAARLATERDPVCVDEFAKGLNDYFWYRRTVSEVTKGPIV